MILKQLRPGITLFVILTAVTGVFYPLAVSGTAQIFFSRQAGGSLIYKEGKAVGSEWIGQFFDDPKYLWGRPSAASPAYNAASSSGSNFGPSNPDYLNAVKQRIQRLRAADPGNSAPVPVDLVTASASGLDPHISLAGAYYQIPRIAKARGISPEAVIAAVKKNTKGRFLNLIGEPAVNVLKVNLDLDEAGK